MWPHKTRIAVRCCLCTFLLLLISATRQCPIIQMLPIFRATLKQLRNPKLLCGHLPEGLVCIPH